MQGLTLHAKAESLSSGKNQTIRASELALVLSVRPKALTPIFLMFTARGLELLLRVANYLLVCVIWS